MSKIFRGVALVEGVTTLLLFLVAMPLKYLAGSTALMPVAGMGHGIAFLAYVVLMVPALWGKVDALGWLRTFGAALFPFGTFLNDPWLKRNI